MSVSTISYGWGTFAPCLILIWLPGYTGLPLPSFFENVSDVTRERSQKIDSRSRILDSRKFMNHESRITNQYKYMKKQLKQFSMTDQPLVSVVMPVYNAGEYLVEAIESILNQTYTNFEFIIVDDASTDNSFEILKSFEKRYKNIKVYRNRRNVGVSTAVKRAIDKVKGQYLARMDADDIATPDRLEKQVAYLQSHKRTVAIGGQCLLIDKDSNIIGKKTFPTSFKAIYKYIFQFIPLQQATLMIDRSKLPSTFEYYIDGMNTAEEVELFFKLFQYGKVENLNETLLYYRYHNRNTSFLNVRRTFFLTLISRIKAVYHYGYKPTTMGIAITLLQTGVVFLLPQAVTLFMYRSLIWTMRHNLLFFPKKKTSFAFQPAVA
jgi:glycosyltransferase involved in cell wall biosynthesis